MTNQPVRLGLVFPRSGQQLTISVSSTVAEDIRNQSDLIVREKTLPQPIQADYTTADHSRLK